MENQLKSVVCPNCGATTKNLHNCEYCGSFLVQKIAEGVNVDKYVKKAKTYSNDVIYRVVEQFIEESKESPNKKDCVRFEIPTLEEKYTAVSTFIISGGDESCIRLSLNFINLPQQYYQRFKNSSISDIFSFRYLPKEEMRIPNEHNYEDFEYYVEMGYDVEGATRIILQLTDEVLKEDPYELVYEIQKGKKTTSYNKEGEKESDIKFYIIMVFTAILIIGGLVLFLIETFF